MLTTDHPTFLAVETREGRATLGGKRRLLDDLTEAVEAADEIDGQVFALEPVEVVDITPVSASTHIRLVGVPGLDPEPRVVAGMACPCGARGEMYEGDDRDEWDEYVATHDDCRAEVA
ncbi:hypothetical protein [Microbacterium sp.]|uniref:hypothetical protein n=1 Tax=Microbacterium sp. TaxID=51671 RepID=UPI003A8D9282